MNMLVFNFAMSHKKSHWKFQGATIKITHKKMDTQKICHAVIYSEDVDGISNNVDPDYASAWPHYFLSDWS